MSRDNLSDDNKPFLFVSEDLRALRLHPVARLAVEEVWVYQHRGKGWCTASEATLAGFVGVDIKTLARHLRQLIAARLVEHGGGGHATRTPKRLRVNVDEIRRQAQGRRAATPTMGEEPAPAPRVIPHHGGSTTPTMGVATPTTGDDYPHHGGGGKSEEVKRRRKTSVPAPAPAPSSSSLERNGNGNGNGVGEGQAGRSTSTHETPDLFPRIVEDWRSILKEHASTPVTDRDEKAVRKRLSEGATREDFHLVFYGLRGDQKERDFSALYYVATKHADKWARLKAAGKRNAPVAPYVPAGVTPEQWAAAQRRRDEAIAKRLGRQRIEGFEDAPAIMPKGAA